MKQRICFSIIFFCYWTLAQAAVDFDLAKGQTEFLAIGKPSFIKIKGEAAAPTGKLNFQENILSGELRMDLCSFHTGIELRDEHLHKTYLECDKEAFKTAKLKIDKLSLEPAKNETSFEGTLSLHGTERVISGKLNYTRNPKSLIIDANFEIALEDFGIETPQYNRIKVTDKVQIRVQADAPIKE